MKRKSALGLWMAAFLLLVSGAAPPVAAQLPASSQLRLLSWDERGIVLELTVADAQFEAVERAGQAYHGAHIPGMAQTATPGDPQVPTRGALLGLPTAKGVTVQVLEARYDLRRGYRLPPAPGFQVTGDTLAEGDVQLTFTPNPARYATDAFYPGPLVAVGQAGMLRDQAVAQVQFYPLQYNPARGEVRLYRHILARVTWDLPPLVTDTEARGASPAYERLLQEALLNYATLDRPPVRAPPPHMPGAIVIPADVTPTLKIRVTEEGLYELTYADLTGAGLDLHSVDPRTLQLHHRGVKVPVYVPGEEDGVFDPGDVLLFYGSALNDVYTDQNVYWLAAGEDDGRRMGARSGTPSGEAPVPAHFAVTHQAERDTHYWATMPNGWCQDHWFWRERLSAPAWREYGLTLRHVSTAASMATVRVRLKGRTDAAIAPDHHTRIYLNGVEIDDQWWDGFQIYDHQVTVPHSTLNKGYNVLRVEGAGDTGAAADQFFVNWIEIDYWDTYVAEDDALFFGAPAAGTFQFEVARFGQEDVQLFEVTDPADVVHITDPAVVADGGRYKLQFEDAAQTGTRYLALTPARRKSPASLELDQPSSWRSPDNGADYVLIAHEDFYASALRLADHRSAAGLRVAVVQVEDIYDEFNHGIANPRAIRDFLSYAYGHWVAPAPAYVLLLGGASYDYKDLLDLDRASYVPAQLVETASFGQVPSDNWFVQVSGADLLPDLFVGRLTPQTPSEAEDMVDKIIYYEGHPPDNAWNKQVLLVAGGWSSEFAAISERLASHLPFYYTVNKVYADDYPPDGDPTADIARYINRGSVLINHTGHGSVRGWGTWRGGQIFMDTDVAALNNTHRLPVVTIANCLNGYFIGWRVSMAETFLQRADKGAVAVWANSGLGYPSGLQALMEAFYEAVFQDDLYALGAATTAAKVATYAQGSFWGELVETYVLLGDPALQLGIPANDPYLESTIPADGDSDVPVDQDLQIVFSKPMDPATVRLDGQGTAGLTFTPTWNAKHTVLGYAHPNFGHRQTLTFTIGGQDRLGNPLGAGLVPTTWSFVTAPPVGVDGVTLAGPVKGAIDTPHTFRAIVSPLAASPPITYAWQASGQAPLTHTGGSSDRVTFTWHTTGTQVVTVTATNVGGTVTDTHLVILSPIAVKVTGPARGAIHTPYAFTTTVSPLAAAQPITYAWQASGQDPLLRTGGLSDTVTFTWHAPGQQAITVTATNAEGTVTDTHRVAVGAPPTGVEIAGPAAGTVNVPCTFTAHTHPLTATQPITYVWQAAGQPSMTHVAGLSDTITVTWRTTGTHTLTLTAANAGGMASNVRTIAIHDALPGAGTWSVYLPFLARNH